MALSIYPVQLD